MTSQDLMVVKPDDPAYVARAAAEAEYWSKQHPIGMEVWEATVDDGPADLHTNERFTGNRHMHWYETIAKYGQRQGGFRRGLILGTSGLHSEATMLRTNPGMHVTFADISEGGLQRRIERFSGEFPGRVDTTVADFNFLELEPKSYDAIISSSSIHHVTNLEHLAAQINGALTDSGYFFLNDYVGEPRFSANATKRRMYELISDRDCRRHGLEPQPIEWLDDSDLSPFCGVRSDEIPRVFSEVMVPERVRTAGALTVPLLRSRRLGPGRPEPWLHRAQSFLRKIDAKVRRQPDFQRGRIDQRFYDELMLVGETLADAGVILPGNIFGVYRRR